MADLAHDLATKLMAATWTIAAVSTTFLAVRLVARLHYAKSLWWDDMILILAWMFLIPGNAFVTLDIIGRGNNDSYYVLLAKSMSSITIALTKDAFCLTILKLLNRSLYRWSRWIIFFILATLNPWAILLTYATWVRICDFPVPPGDVRLDSLISGSCWDVAVVAGMAEGYMFYSALTDITLAMVPLYMISQLQLDVKEKIGAAAAMGCGLLLAAISLTKMGFAHTTLDDAGFQVWYRISAILDLAEPFMTIVAQSMPLLRWLILCRRSGGDMADEEATAGGLRVGFCSLQDTKGPSGVRVETWIELKKNQGYRGTESQLKSRVSSELPHEQ